MSITYNPIGTFYSTENEKYQIPNQSGLDNNMEGFIEINKDLNVSQVLHGLEGFNFIWIIFHFHKVDNWKNMISVQRSEKKQGVFSTRSPHRPNPIGISCIEVKEIKGREIRLISPDLMNGTPILDLKPYLAYSDSKPNASNGWLENQQTPEKYSIELNNISKTKISWLGERKIQIMNYINTTLVFFPQPNKKKRIQLLAENDNIFNCELACKTWRISYNLNENNKSISITDIYSGYKSEYLNYEKESNWDDVPTHNDFNEFFKN